MEQEAIAIAGERERHIQRFGITQCLLHAEVNGVFVVFRLDYADRQVGLVTRPGVGKYSITTICPLDRRCVLRKSAAVTG